MMTPMKKGIFLIATLSGCVSLVAGIDLRPVFPEGSNGVFVEDQNASFAFELKNQKEDPVEVGFYWQVASDKGDKGSRTSLSTIQVAGGEERIVRYVTKVPAAGFYKGTIFCRWGEKEVSRTVQVGYAPEKLKPPLTRESDFELFWRNSLRSLRKVDPEYRLMKQPALSMGQLDVYEVQMRSHGKVRVKGWYEVPKTPGPHPVLLRVPGYGSNMRPISRFSDMIVFSFNPRGHGNSQDDVKGQPRNFWVRGLDHNEGYYYQGAYLDCVRAVDFLCSRKEVDTSRIAVKGGSQGGGLSFVTAGLDQRISLCVPHIPFMACWPLYFKTSQWPEMDEWIAARESRSWRKTLKTMSYFDSMNMASWIKCPVFMGVGLQDAICPPATNFAVYNRLTGPREVRVYPLNKHSVPSEFHVEAFAWIRKNFGLPVPGGKD